MEPVMKKLYLGTISADESIVSKDKIYKEKEKLKQQSIARFLIGLTDEKKKEFDKVEESIFNCMPCEIEEAFAYGMTLGIKLMIEAHSTDF